MDALWRRRVDVVAAGHAVRPPLHDAILKRVDLSQNVNNLETEQSEHQKEDERG
jgi:hypothetical protein